MNPPPSHLPHPNHNDDSEFDALLRSAKAEAPLPGTFQAEVWRRIAVAQEATFSARFSRWAESVFSALVRPAWATAAVAVMVTAGAWLGSMGTAEAGDGKVAYVQSVSPFAQAHAHGEGGR